MKRLKQTLSILALLFFISSCGFFGIHINVHNPRKAGKYPQFDKETILLGESNTLRTGFDVCFYDLDIQINPSEKAIGGWVEIMATALRDIDSIQLDLDQPLRIEELRLNSKEGVKLQYSRNYRAVIIKLNERVKKGELFSIQIKYSGKPIIAKKAPWAGGLVWKKDKHGLPWAGVACEREGASIWFPCKDVTSDEPDSVNMRYEVSDRRVSVVSNGVLAGVNITGTSKTYNWKVSYPINLYDITFYVGDFVKIEDTYIGINMETMNMSYYVFKDNLEVATKHFKQVKEIIYAYEELYGEYPWYRDGFKLIESPYKGMEHQTAIAYGNGYKNDLKGELDYIILHETGHEWFGNAITASDLADIWLQEGITTYGEALYMEKKYGNQEGFFHLLLYRLMIKNKYPIVGPMGRRYFDYKDGDVYTKGAWTMHSLRNVINNDTIFFRIIRTFYEENKLKTTSSKIFIETVNRITGKDYGWFFDQYLYQRTAPVFEYQFTSDGGIYYRWANVTEGFNQMQVPVLFDYSDEVVQLKPSLKVRKFMLPQGQKIYGIKSFGNNNILFGTNENKKLKKIFMRQVKNKDN